MPKETKWGTLSPWWRRVVAEVIDLAIVFAITSLMLLIVGEHPWWHTHRGHLTAANIVRYITVDIAALLYYPPLVWRTDGQTVGKRILQIRVIRTDSHRMGLAFAAWREVGIKFVLPDLLTVLPLVGFALSELFVLADVLWPLWDPENRALHDMLARTRVMRAVPTISHSTSEIANEAGL